MLKKICFSKTLETFTAKRVKKRIVYISHRVYSSHPCFQWARCLSTRWFIDLTRISGIDGSREFGSSLQKVKSMQIWVRGNSR